MFLFSYFLFKFNRSEANFASRFIGVASQTFGIAGFKNSAVSIGFSQSRHVAKLSVFVLDSLFCKLIAES